MYIIQKNLEELLTKNWISFIDRNKLFRKVLEDTRNIEFPKKLEKDNLSTTTKLSITEIKIGNNRDLEVMVEFNVPKENGIVIGTYLYLLELTGELYLKESYGMYFEFEN